MNWTTAQLRRLSVWLVCAMLLAALAPTVSRARALSQSSALPWMEVCSVNGSPSVAVNLATSEKPEQSLPSGHNLVDHCALCVLASDRMAPPTTPLLWQGLPQAPPLLGVLTVCATPTVLHWTVLSRAPPGHA
jgi:hypothetical protein